MKNRLGHKIKPAEVDNFFKVTSGLLQFSKFFGAEINAIGVMFLFTRLQNSCIASQHGGNFIIAKGGEIDGTLCSFPGKQAAHEIGSLIGNPAQLTCPRLGTLLFKISGLDFFKFIIYK